MKLSQRGEKYLWEYGALNELATGTDMAALAVQRAILAKTGKSTKPLRKVLPDLIEQFMTAWANRAREGGLRDAAGRMAELGREF